MSSRREVLIRILALLQRKTLIETKNRTLKCLKRHYSTVRSLKNVVVLTEDGAFALFFRPHPGRFDSSRVPTPGNLPSVAKKILMPGGQPGGRGARRSWNWLMYKRSISAISRYASLLWLYCGHFSVFFFNWFAVVLAYLTFQIFLFPRLPSSLPNQNGS